MFSPFNNQTHEELWIYCVQTKYLVTYTDIYEKERQQQQSELLLAKFEQSLHNHCTVVNILIFSFYSTLVMYLTPVRRFYR